MIILSRRSALALASSAALAPLIGCQRSSGPSAPAPAPANTADADFTKIAKTWMDATDKSAPSNATALGDHRFDAELDDVSETGRAVRAQIVKETTAALAAIERAKLSRENQVDAAMLDEALDAETFSLDQIQDWSWDPLLYSRAGSGALYTLMAREFAPIEERLISAAARMERLPVFLEQVRQALIVERVPEVHADVYSGQNGGATSIIDELILPAADKLGPADRKRLKAAADLAKNAVASHQTWIKKTLVPGAKGDFRLGPQNYDVKLRLSISETTPRAELHEQAEGNARRSTMKCSTLRRPCSRRRRVSRFPPLPMPSKSRPPSLPPWHWLPPNGHHARNCSTKPSGRSMKRPIGCAITGSSRCQTRR
jgi:uncharacterized protein DUF885